MLKKAFNKLREKWKEISVFGRVIRISIVLAIILGIITVSAFDLKDYQAEEVESLVMLEEIANDMIENKNLEQPLNETLKSYDVSYNEDCTIDILLKSNYDSAWVKLKISNDFSIKSFEKGTGTTVGWFIFSCVIIMVAYWMAFCIILEIIYRIWRGLYRFFKT